jgi:hypothetical protein
MELSPLYRASEGKSSSKGGLNLPEFRRQMEQMFPLYAGRIRTANRSQLQVLAEELLQPEVVPAQIPSFPSQVPILSPRARSPTRSPRARSLTRSPQRKRS